ncbi:MAG: HAMP domain-containing protein [Bdellovibrionales bacterium]|nr:HAMP domain-containing protein [Bdellovibrionales bacterium]
MSTNRALSLHTALFLAVAPFLIGAAAISAYLTYKGTYAAILDGFDNKLSAAAATRAVFLKGSDHETLMQMGSDEGEQVPGVAEESPLYQLYSIPMQRILNESGLTYHYTFVLRDATRIAYGIDATTGEDHSFLGTEEDNPTEESERLARAAATGSISISPIQQFDNWGKLKIANAPIRTEDGRVTGLVGADVNISVIDKKTRVAFLQVLGAGIVSLLFAALMTWYLARRIAVPLERLKASALRIGGGQFGETIEAIKQPELSALADALETLGQTLRTAPARVSADAHEVAGEVESHTSASDDFLAEYAEHPSSESLLLLRQNPLFRILTDAELAVVAQASRLVDYKPGALIASRGISPSFALLVESGSVEGDMEYVRDGIIGIDAVLSEEPLANDLVASSEGARCLLIQKEHLFTIVHECPSMLTGLIESHLAEAR